MTTRLSGGLLGATGGGAPNTGGGLLGGGASGAPSGTAQMMQSYLQGLYRRQYNPPAIAQQPGMVGSQMGVGGMQYTAPQVQRAELPKGPQSALQQLLGSQEDQDQALINWLRQYHAYQASGGGGG